MVLRHRDRELLRFEWVEPQGVRVVSVNETERRFLPLEMHGIANGETLWTWLTRRTVPKHRHYGGCVPVQRWNRRCCQCRLWSRIPSSMPRRLPRQWGSTMLHTGWRNSKDAIEDFLQKRASEILEFGDCSDDLLKIEAVSDSVNHVANGSLALQIKSNLRVDPFMTYVELAELLQVSESSIARKMKDLQASGEIRRVGADKNGHWEVVG